MALSETTPGIVVFKNNIFQVSNGASMMRSGQWTGSQFVHENNIYKISGGGALNFTLSSSELSSTQDFWQNTTSSNPLLWDFNLLPNSQPINFGQSVSLSRDFAGSPISGQPDLGIFEFTAGNVGGASLSASATVTPMLCYAGTTSVVISATGGMAPYSGTGTFTHGVGTYTYIITDARGTRDTVQAVVTQPTVVNPNVVAGTIAVAGGTTSITATASGGTGSIYQYSINGSVYQNSGTFSNISAGTYTVTAKDQNGCIGARSITITEPAVAALTATSSVGSILCNGGTTTVTISATGGVPPYTGTGSFTASAGTQVYTVSDSRGTVTTVSVSVSQPTAVSVTLSSGSISQNGGTTSITATASGGTGNAYQYSINGSAYQTSGTFNNISAGTYIVAAKDQNNCVGTRSITITEPAVAALTATSSIGSILCNGGTTTVTISATGGVPPYTGTGSFTVSAGTRVYTVSDSRGTSTTVSVSVSQPTAVSVTLSSGSISQNGGTTSITATASGGTGSIYQYSINGSAYQTSGTFSNISAGTYTVTARDQNGCLGTRNITITEPSVASLTATSSVGSILCNGGTTTVTISATGGVQPYTGTGSFTVSAGTRVYTVSDSRGASTTLSVSVSQPTAVTFSTSSGSITTQGGSTSIIVNASGGTVPYVYSINGGSYQTSNQFTGVGAGTHTISVKDANGCIKTGNTTIATPIFDSLKVTATTGTITCFGGTAPVTIAAIGGNGPYTGTGTFFMSAGTRIFTVIDATGAISNLSVTLTQPTDMVVLVNVAADIQVIGGTTSVTITATGGVGPYLYSLDGGVSQTSNTFRSVTGGAHTISVVDQNRCIKIVPFVVNTIESSTNPLRLSILSKSDVSCRGARDGKVEVIASGGRAPYQYSIGGGSYGINNIFSNLKAGYYRIRVRDANQTIASVVVQINDGRRSCGRSMNEDNEEIGTVNIRKTETIIYPNPSNSEFNIKIDADSDKEASIEMIDMYGKKLMQAKARTGTSIKMGQQLKAGIYFVRVIIAGEVTTTKVIKL
jgi:hypothetical protein